MSSNPDRTYTLDPVTFEVLKNAFVNIVDQMAEQIFRTCYSFVIYSRDFSSALCDPNGDTIMQGSGDIAAHVGTLHYTAKAVLNNFGDDMHEGDVFVVNDVYQGGTHFNDTRVVRPIFWEGEIIAYGPGERPLGGCRRRVRRARSTSTRSTTWREGLRITPVRVWRQGPLSEGRSRTDRQQHAGADATSSAICRRSPKRRELPNARSTA